MKIAAILVITALSTPLLVEASDADRRALDAAVMSAIARGDLGHARSLATTERHWGMIRDAQGGGQGPRTRADVRSEMGNSQACREAQRSAQIEAGRIKQDWHAIEAARQAAGAACGSYRY
jgi:hypothetical protein